MSESPDLAASELLRWLTVTADNWRRLLTANPTLLAAPCDIAGATTVAGLIQHIVAVQLRYAERLALLPITDYADIPTTSVQSLFSVHDRSLILFQQLLSAEIDWQERIEFGTRTLGTMRASRRFILFHAMTHGIRHYAQLAVLARQHGVKPDWSMDLLLLDEEHVPS
ncbi:MAG: DinB family protein [Granulicella sp.]